MSAALQYFVCNEAGASELSPTTLGVACADMQAGYDMVFAARWGVLPVLVSQVGDENTARVLHLVDTIPEAPDALAYHTVDDQGRPVLRLGVETIRSYLTASQNLIDEITKAMSHEVFETAMNPFVGLYCWVPGKTVMLSYEVCDPVQGGAWKQGSSMLSDFVLPAYFDAEDLEGPFNYLGTLVAPLSCASDGYQSWSDGQQTFGADVPGFKKRDVENYGRLAMRKAA